MGSNVGITRALFRVLTPHICTQIAQKHTHLVSVPNLNNFGGGGVVPFGGRSARPFERNPTTWVPQAPMRNGKKTYKKGFGKVIRLGHDALRDLHRCTKTYYDFKCLKRGGDAIKGAPKTFHAVWERFLGHSLERP